MPARSHYKPKIPTGGNLDKTNQRNFEEIFAILNRMEARITDLESIVNSLVITIINGDNESRVMALMMMDDE